MFRIKLFAYLIFTVRKFLPIPISLFNQNVVYKNSYRTEFVPPVCYIVCMKVSTLETRCKGIGKIVAVLLSFTLSGSLIALDIVFKDGTWMKGAEIYAPAKLSSGSPDARGVDLLFRNKLYIHHYPYRKPRMVQRQMADKKDDGIYDTIPVQQALEHYAPPAPYALDVSPYELGYSCTPSRIPFIHFDRPTLKRMYISIQNNRNIPLTNRRAALKSINKAWNYKPNPNLYNTSTASRRWQLEADADVRLFREKVWYGKWFEKK